MNKVLIAVDNTNNSKGILSLFRDMVSVPDSIVLLHVEQIEGNSMMTAMLGEAEIKTLKDSLKGSEHQEALDRKAENLLTYYKKELQMSGLINIKTIIKEGHPSEEILKTAEEEKVDLIIVGCSGKTRLHRFVSGCASRDVEKNAKVPVLITKGNGCGRHAHMWSGREAYAVQ